MPRLRSFLLPCTLLSCISMGLAQEAALFTDIAKIVSTDKTGTEVRVHGVVTCTETGSFFVQDNTGALQVAIANASALVKAGDAVDASGSLMRTGTELQLRAGQVLKTGVQALPTPRYFSNHDLITLGRSAQGKRVRVTGSVQDVALVLDEVRLQVWNYNAPVVVVWRLTGDGPARLRPDDLLDAIVDATGVAQLDGAANRAGTTPIKIVLASRDDLHVLKAGSPDIFTRPLHTVKSLHGPVADNAERSRVIGIVTYASPFGQFYVQDESGTAQVEHHHLLDLSDEVRRHAQPNTVPQAGDVVEAVGSVFHQPGDKFMPVLLNAEWRILSHGRPPRFQPTLARTIMEGGFDGQNVSIAGQFVGFEVKHQPYGDVFTHALTLDDNGIGFVVFLHTTELEHIPVNVGEYMRVNGMVKTVHNPQGAVISFSVLAASSKDLQGAPTPWRREVVMRWVIGLAVAALAALIWIILLRRQVRAQTTRLLEANEKLTRFKALMDSATDMISILGLDVVPQYVNPAGRAMLGIGPGEPASVATTESVFAPASAARILAEGIPHALVHGSWSSEIEMQHRDGHTIPVSFVGLVVKDASGEPLCMGCITRNISERKAMEQQLREANLALERFKAIADTTSDLIGMATLDLKPLYMNPAGRAMLGIGKDEDVTGMAFDSIYTPEAMEQLHREGLAAAMEHGHWHGEVTMQHRLGRAIPVSLVGIIIKSSDGTPLYMGCIARDLSARMAMEQQLREANLALERFKAIVDTTSDFVGMATLDRKTVFINPAGRTLLGIGQDEDVTEILLDSIYTAETMERFPTEFVPAVMTHGVWQGEVDKLHRDGHAIRVSMVGSLVYSTDGTPAYLCCVSRDLSARLATEKQLRDSLELERELNQLKSSFVNTISHEFRTPLGIILFASSMMERYNHTFTPEDRAEQLGDIQQAVGRMNDLVEQTLCLGRADAARPEMHSLDFNSLCTRIVDEVLSAAARRSPVTFQPDASLPLASSDETMLRAIIVNLLTNAVKYSPPGTQVVLSVVRDADKATIIVRDHGPGLQQADLPKLFTSFQRGSGTEGIVGSGLGLAIVKRCAEALGGSVVARNADGGGAEFIVELPHFFLLP